MGAVVAIVLVLLTAGASPLRELQLSAAAPVVVHEPGHRALLIKHGWDIPSPAFVRDHLAAMDTSPFDGLTVTLPQSSRIMSHQLIPPAAFAAALAPMAGLKPSHLRHNFVITYARPINGGYFSDWSATLANYKALGSAARAAGFEGIAYDGEDYFGTISDYPKACRGHGIARCKEQAALRGQQVMSALRSAWPTVRMLVLQGPWLSDAATAPSLAPYLSYTGTPRYSELTAPFFLGMLRSTRGTAARLIDGGEIYGAGSRSQFAQVYAWLKHGLPSLGTVVPADLRSSYASDVSVGFTVYDGSVGGRRGTAARMRAALAAAMSVADDYVLLYTERYTWWPACGRHCVPTEWVDAVKAARADSAAFG